VIDDHHVLASVGSVGDAYDNAMAESFVDSFKTELIKDRVWQTRSQVELAVLEYVDWFNHRRLHESLGDIPPVEFEQLHATPTDALPGDPSVAGLSPSGSERLTTSRFETGPAENHLNEPDPARTTPNLVVDESSQLVSLTLRSDHHQPMETY
jgi:putative transposase